LSVHIELTLMLLIFQVFPPSLLSILSHEALALLSPTTAVPSPYTAGPAPVLAEAPHVGDAEERVIVVFT
jgi:hypothetical protein